MASKQVSGSIRRRPPAAGKGRPKGSPNKLTRSAKEAFRLAFEELGGAQALTAWAKDNQTDFYKLYARMIPNEQQISGADGAEVHFMLHLPGKAATTN